MFEALRRVDDWIIDRGFQPVCNALAGWTTCYRISAFWLTGAILALLATMVGLVMRGMWYLSPAFLLIAAVWIPQLRVAYLLDQLNSPAAFVFPRLLGIGVRYMDVLGAGLLTGMLSLLAAPHTSDLTYVTAWYLKVLANYFLACRMMPPRKRRAPRRLSWLRWRPA